MPNRFSFFKKNKTPDAPGQASQVLQQQPHQAQNAGSEQFFRSAGDRLVAQGQYNSAVVMYDQAIEESPTNVELLVARSLARMLSSPPQLDLALVDAIAAISLDATNGKALLQKARLHQRKGELAEARTGFHQAITYSVGETRISAQIALAGMDNSIMVPPSPSAEPVTPPKPLPQRPATTSAAPTSPGSPPNSTPQRPAATARATVSPTTPPNTAPQRPVTTATMRASPTTPSNTTFQRPATTTSPILPTNPTNSAAQRPPTTVTPSVSPTNASNPASARPVTSGLSPQSTSRLPDRTNQPSGATKSPSAAGPSSVRATQPVRAADSAATSVSTARTNVSPQTASSTSTTPGANRRILEEILADSTENPPQYFPNLSSIDPTIAALSQQDLTNQLADLGRSLAVKYKGSIAINRVPDTGNRYQVRVLYIGLLQLEITNRELPPQTYSEAGFQHMHIRPQSFPGTTYADQDPETACSTEGPSPGTLSVSGFNEEYLQQQYLTIPRIGLALERLSVLPEIPLVDVVAAMRKHTFNRLLEDDVTLAKFLGLTSAGLTRQAKIENICFALNKSFHAAPSRFKDFRELRNISPQFLGGTGGMGARNFLFQIQLGAELLCRLRKEPPNTDYAGCVTDKLSALLVLSDLFYRGIQMGLRPVTSLLGTPMNSPLFYPLILVKQAATLIKFAEELNWPYLDEARTSIEELRAGWSSGVKVGLALGADLCDWFFGLILPGKVFVHRIMACLVAATPSAKSIGASPTYDSGIIVNGVSYWPKRTTVARVLGGRAGVKSVCGWIGPLPAPANVQSGWASCPVSTTPWNPQVRSAQSDVFGVEFPNDPTGPDSTLYHYLRPDLWVAPRQPTLAADSLEAPKRQASFTSLTLASIPTPASTPVVTPGAVIKDYRATIEFNVKDNPVTYTLFSNPFIVSAPPCVGTHVLHTWDGEAILKNAVKAVDLKSAQVDKEKLLFIDALGAGEESVARAWCAERHRNAVIRKGSQTCFACACNCAVGIKGLGFNVLIWAP